MSLGFYRAFEERFRGPRELIKSRLRIYLPFIAVLKEVDSDCKALDVGCGRGEWLELLKELEVDAHGVDLDDGMLDACRALGLSAEIGDAISYIKSLPSESLSVVSGFHFAEHIPFTSLQVFVQEALRVLKPAGLLILETPNPENIVVGTSSFYLDPTHQNPIPSQLLVFLSDYYGFYRTKILRLQEAPELRENTDLNLLDVLGGVSPDYSIVAQKNGSRDALSAFQDVFETNHGLTLNQLAARYNIVFKKNIQSEKEYLQTEIENLSAEKELLRTDLSGVRADLERVILERADLRTELDKFSADRMNLQAEFNVREKEIADLFAENQRLRSLDLELSRVKAELTSVYLSTSWMITAPIRHIKAGLLSIIKFARHVTKKIER